MSESIENALKNLKLGGCVAMPTETVYGLAARIDSADGIANIFKLKQRPSFDPLIVHISNLEQVHDVVSDWPQMASMLAREFWPGPLTLVLKKKPSLNPMITSGLETVGLRMPDHRIALQLIEAAGCPLAAPSANRFGRTSPTTAAHVRDEFKDEIASGSIVVLDGGDCEVGVESTVCLVEDHQLVILRPGGITREKLSQFVSKSRGFDDFVVIQNSGSVQSPGHTEHHYETLKPLIVSWSEPFEARERYTVSGQDFKREEILQLNLGSEPEVAARLLYAKLREGDADARSKALFIGRDLSREFGTSGLWQAIDDRLSRAARLKIGSKPESGV